MQQMMRGGGMPGMPGMGGVPGMPGVGPGKRSKGKQQPRKGKGGGRRSGNPAAAGRTKAEPQRANPFGGPGQDVDYEQAAAALDLPKDFSKFLK